MRSSLVMMALVLASSPAHADDVGVIAQQPVVLAQVVTLPESVRIFRDRGFDVLLANAAAMHAEGDVDAVAHVANPGLSGFVGHSFNITPDQPAWSFGVSITDNGAIFDLITGKRSLRARAANAALDAARDHRASVELGLEANVKQAYVQVAFRRLQIQFTDQQAKSLSKTVDIARLRYPAMIDESDLARVEMQQLEAEQARSNAQQALRSAQTGLALLLGMRTAVPDFDVDRTPLAYRVPPALANVTESSLLALALAHRPEIAEMRDSVAHAEGSLDLEKRRVFPDVSLGAFVAGQGSGTTAISPPVAGGMISFNVPVFYQQQGEVKRATSDVSLQSLTVRKVESQITFDVASAFAAYQTSRMQVDRMVGGQLDAAVRQRDVLQKQFDAGKADLNDFLDAQRTYLNVQLEYLQLVAAYWTAVFALERATGMDLR